MRKVAAVLCVTVFSGSYAFGGMVEFSKGEFDPDNPAPVTLEVTVIGDAPYDFADILFGSNDVPITGFLFSEEWGRPGEPGGAFSFVAIPVLDPLGFFTSELFSSSTNATPVGPTLNMGMLVVDPTGLGLTRDDAGMQLQVVVSNDPLPFNLSQVGTAQGTEQLFGMGIINVVPEPGTLSLLGLAALGLIRRRRKSA